MRIANVERASRPVHRSVGPGDPTYTTVVVFLVCVSETHRSKLLMPFSKYAFDEDDKRRTGLQARSQIGRAWRPDLHYRSRSSRVRERNPSEEVAHAFL
jgi:hypothetical protein